MSEYGVDSSGHRSPFRRKLHRPRLDTLLPHPPPTQPRTGATRATRMTARRFVVPRPWTTDILSVDAGSGIRHRVAIAVGRPGRRLRLGGKRGRRCRRCRVGFDAANVLFVRPTSCPSRALRTRRLGSRHAQQPRSPGRRMSRQSASRTNQCQALIAPPTTVLAQSTSFTSEPQATAGPQSEIRHSEADPRATRAARNPGCEAG